MSTEDDAKRIAVTLQTGGFHWEDPDERYPVDEQRWRYYGIWSSSEVRLYLGNSERPAPGRSYGNEHCGKVEGPTVPFLGRESQYVPAWRWEFGDGEFIAGSGTAYSEEDARRACERGVIEYLYDKPRKSR